MDVPTGKEKNAMREMVGKISWHDGRVWRVTTIPQVDLHTLSGKQRLLDVMQLRLLMALSDATEKGTELRIKIWCHDAGLPGTE